MSQQIYRYLLDNTDFDLPVDVVAEHSTSLLQRQYSSLLMRGLAREQIEEQMEQLRAGSEQQAKEQLKTFYIMDKISEELKIDVSEEEINGHIAQLAIQRGQRPERLREEMVRDGSLAQFRLQVRENKCIAKLLESAEITEIKPEKKGKKTRKNGKVAKETARKSAKKTVKKATAEYIIEKIEFLNEKISKDKNLGPGFQVGHSYFCNLNMTHEDDWYYNIIQHEIAPLLKEYWFDDMETADAQIKRLLEDY